MSNKESKVQKKIMDVIRDHGGYVSKNPQSIYTERGKPDLTACIPVTVGRLRKMYPDDKVVGLYVGLECKQKNLIDDTSLGQEVVGRQIKKAGGIFLPIDDPMIILALIDKFQEVKNG